MSRTIKQIISIIDNNSMCQYYVCYLHILLKKRIEIFPTFTSFCGPATSSTLKSWWWKCTWPSLKAIASLRKLAIPCHQWPLLMVSVLGIGIANNQLIIHQQASTGRCNPSQKVWINGAKNPTWNQSAVSVLMIRSYKLSKWWLLTTQVQFCKKTITAHQY